MSVRAPFNPRYGAGQILTPGVASAQATIGVGNKNLCLTNQGAAVCYVRPGPAGTVATTADYAVPPNSQVVITKFEDDTTLAHISPTGTTLHVIPGEGW